MSPFDLTGPKFLVFYAALASLTLGALVLVRRARESHGTNLRLSDPYLIAYLRGGYREALRLVAISLVGRRLLEQTGTLLETVSDGVAQTRHALERAVLQRFQQVADAGVLFSDRLLQGEAEQMGRTLERHGLLPDDAVRRARIRRFAVALALLIGVALTKILVALSRGRGNVWFLILLAVLASLVAADLTQAARTARGDATLADLRTLFARLRARAPQLGREDADEALLLAAVFGVDSLPWDWRFASEMFPRAVKKQDSSWSISSSSSCGSSCGSSGSSCGSSCGGGCGGGCGGCGS